MAVLAQVAVQPQSKVAETAALMVAAEVRLTSIWLAQFLHLFAAAFDTIIGV